MLRHMESDNLKRRCCYCIRQQKTSLVLLRRISVCTRRLCGHDRLELEYMRRLCCSSVHKLRYLICPVQVPGSAYQSVQVYTTAGSPRQFNGGRTTDCSFTTITIFDKYKKQYTTFVSHLFSPSFKVHIQLEGLIFFVIVFDYFTNSTNRQSQFNHPSKNHSTNASTRADVCLYNDNDNVHDDFVTGSDLIRAAMHSRRCIRVKLQLMSMNF